MKEIVVYTKSDYSENKSIFVNKDLTRFEIKQEINKKFKVWYFFDILNIF